MGYTKLLDEKYLKILLFNKELNLKTISQNYGVSTCWIRRTLKKYGIDSKGSNKDRTTSKRLLIDMIERGHGIAEIEKEIKKGHTYVNKILKEYGMGVPRKIVTNELNSRDWLIQKHYHENLKVRQLAALLGCSVSPIERALRDHGIRRSNRIDEWKTWVINFEDVERMHQVDHMSVPEIANHYDVPVHEMRRFMKESNIEIFGKSVGIVTKHLNDKDWMHTKHIIERVPSHVIADVCNCSLAVAHRKLRSHGIKPMMPSAVIDERYNNEDWLREHHIEKKLHCGEIAEILGVSPGTINKKLRSFGIDIRSYHTNKSKQETEVLEYVKTFYDGEVIQSCRNVIHPKELDIYLPEKNIAIEYCGIYWHNELNRENNYHRDKLMLCQEKGIRLITLFENEWIQNRTLVERKIKAIIAPSFMKSCYARALKIDSSPKINDVRDFLNANHIQGSTSYSHAYALRNEAGEMISVCCFIGKQGKWELNRFSSVIRVVGGMSRLLKNFMRDHNVKEVFSFADLRWSDATNNMYLSSGFKLDSVNKPDYKYVLRNGEVKHKFNFRKKNLAKMFPETDMTKTEHEICLENEIYRIYDCGLAKFVYHDQ